LQREAALADRELKAQEVSRLKVLHSQDHPLGTKYGSLECSSKFIKKS
jgi:hypothetical protein